MAAYDLDWPGQRRAFDGEVAEEGAEFDDREFVPEGQSESNGLDRSCEATIYPVLDKPHTPGALGGTGTSNYRRYIRPFLRFPSRLASAVGRNASPMALMTTFEL